MKRTILRATILAAALTWSLGLALMPASATISLSVSSIKQCDTPSCSNTTTVKTDGSGIVSGSVLITANESADLLDAAPKWVRVSVRDNSSGPFTCVVQWTTSSKSFSKSIIWDTRSFPAQSASGCPSTDDAWNQPANYGALTHNGALQVQVQSMNTNNGMKGSSPITILINNPSSAPEWAATPSVSGTSARQPVVTLSWKAVAEPDVVEYHFVRHNPDDSTSEFAVSGASPGNQGCSLSSGTYTCYDTAFDSSAFAGTYDYWVVAYRSSPSGADHCSAEVGGGANCIQSPLSAQKSVSMSEPAPSPSGSPSTGGSTGGSTARPGGTNLGSRPTGVTPSATGSEENPAPQVLGSRVASDQFCFTCGSFGKTLPYGNNSVGGNLPGDGGGPAVGGQNPILAAGSQIGTGSGGTDPKQLWTSVAAGLVLLLTAAHVARVLRATAH